MLSQFLLSGERHCMAASAIQAEEIRPGCLLKSQKTAWPATHAIFCTKSSILVITVLTTGTFAFLKGQN